MSKIIGYVLVVLSLLCVYGVIVGVCKLNEYDSKIVSLNVLLNQQAQVTQGVYEELQIANRRIDQQNKKIKDQDDKIRIQDALIAEARIRNKKR
jgi:hypothetical protein